MFTLHIKLMKYIFEFTIVKHTGEHSMRSIFHLLVLFASISSSWASYFPENYESSRKRFLQYSAEIQTQYQRIEAGRFQVGRENLTIDHIYIPAQFQQKRLIIMTSGTHGPEGYAGSALQALFIEKTLPTLDLSETGIILVHALNPWGFKHGRRDTENNVNLNRNFDISESIFNTKNEGYDQLQRYLEIRKPVRTVSDFPAGSLLYQMVIKKKITLNSLTEAIGKGQYSSPTGINFGGQSFEPQTLYMIDFFKKNAANYKEFFHIDIHTGLGDKGILHIMTKKEMNARSRARLNSVFNKNETNQYEITPPEAEGFYEISGDYANILNKLFPQEDKVIVGVTAEFGTVGRGLLGKIKTINRLVRENRGHFSGYKTQKVEKKVKSDFVELFNPSDKKWQAKVLSKGEFLVNDLVKRFLNQ